jgi:prolyl oligopeptidase PreP (S9A serine peptidase family)
MIARPVWPPPGGAFLRPERRGGGHFEVTRHNQNTKVSTDTVYRDYFPNNQKAPTC